MYVSSSPADRKTYSAPIGLGPCQPTSICTPPLPCRRIWGTLPMNIWRICSTDFGFSGLKTQHRLSFDRACYFHVSELCCCRRAPSFKLSGAHQAGSECNSFEILNSLLQLLPLFEFDGIECLDFDRRAGLGIPAFTGFSAYFRKNSESDQGYLTVLFLQLFRNAVDERIQRSISNGFTDACILGLKILFGDRNFNQ